MLLNAVSLSHISDTSRSIGLPNKIGYRTFACPVLSEIVKRTVCDKKNRTVRSNTGLLATQLNCRVVKSVLHLLSHLNLFLRPFVSFIPGMCKHDVVTTGRTRRIATPPKEHRATVTGSMHKNSRRLDCSSGDMLTDRQTDRPTRAPGAE